MSVKKIHSLLFMFLCALSLSMLTPQAAIAQSASSGGEDTESEGTNGISASLENSVSISHHAALSFSSSVRECANDHVNPASKINCMADKLEHLATEMNTGSINLVSPKIAPKLKRAAKQLRRIARRKPVVKYVKKVKKVKVKTSTGKTKTVKRVVRRAVRTKSVRAMKSAAISVLRRVRNEIRNIATRKLTVVMEVNTNVTRALSAAMRVVSRKI